jgi:hypothetical protein
MEIVGNIVNGSLTEERGSRGEGARWPQVRQGRSSMI